MSYIRISASYLFNINIDGKYLLVKSERRNQYQPIGGCYKYFSSAENFLQSIEATPEKKSNGVSSLMDLRLLIPDKNVDKFIEWYVSGKDREISFDRELKEELISKLTQQKQQLFKDINIEKLASGSFKLFYDEEKDIMSIKPMDIISLNPTPKQQIILNDLCLNSPSSFILASEEEILKGYKFLTDGTKIKIGNHTKNILLDKEHSLKL